MVIISDLFKSKKFPEWFTSHAVFKKITKIKKVFPSIGLPNCEEEVQIDNIAPAKEAAKQLISSILLSIQRRQAALPKYISSKPAMSEARKAHGARCLLLLKTVSELLKLHSNDKSVFIVENNGRLTIRLPSNIVIDGDARPVFREGESLFRVYNKLNDILHDGRFARLGRLEDMAPFKTFSTENVPNGKLKIVFSSDEIDGIWDIATMSMRGVKSCQSWDGEYRHCTIGSVIDPFVGIMYLTSGAKFSEKGSRMIRRCIVRFVIDGKNNKPFLLMDYMYPNDDQKVINQFKKFLKDKTGGKFDVRYAPTLDAQELHDAYMPLTEVRKLLRGTSSNGDENSSLDDLESIASYQDIKISDKSSNKNDKHAVLYEKNSKKKANLFIKDFSESLMSAIKDTDAEMFSEALRPVIGKLKGDKKSFSFSYLVPDFSRLIGNAFIKSIDRNSFTSSDLFAKRIYHSYFVNKTKILNDIKAKITRDINGKLQLKDKNKIRSDHFLSMMKVLLPKVDEAMRPKMRELVSKRTSKKILPLP